MASPLTSAQIRKISRPGKYYDLYGIYLNVKASGASSWVLRYRFSGRERHKGLGPLHLVSQAEARRKAISILKQVMDGYDPLAPRDRILSPTFREAAEAYISLKSSGWKGDSSPEQWRQNLETYAYPILGDMRISDIAQPHVVAVLQPIWAAKVTTANRLRQRIENILDAAKTQGHRAGENPARWSGHLETMFPAKSRVRKVRHHASMPYEEVPAFFEKLEKMDCISSRALQFLILNASRTGEIAGACVSEFDEGRSCWTLPPERMKAGKEHRVPLSTQAQKIAIGQIEALGTQGRFLFPTPGVDEPISNAAMYVLLKRHGGKHYTVHGFRRSFRNWAAETVSLPRELAEMALAHSVAKGAEAAYWTSDLYKRRLTVMQAWADFCVGKEMSKDPQKNLF